MQREIFFLKDPDAHVRHRVQRLIELRSQRREATTRERKGELYADIARESLFLCIARYGRGDALDTVQDDLDKSLRARSQAAKLKGPTPNLEDREEYLIALWTVSLAVLFGKSGMELEQLIREMDLRGHDQFLDLLLPEGMAGRARQILHPEPYGFLVRALATEGEPRAAEIDAFLKTFYAAQKTCSWYDRHLKHEPEFFGYWSFGLAAMVRLYEIEDKTFQGNIFYPRDLTGRELYRTWRDDLQGEHDRAVAGAPPELTMRVEELSAEIIEAIRAEGLNEAELVERFSGLMDPDMAEDPEKFRAFFRQLINLQIQQLNELRQVDPSISPEQQREKLHAAGFEAADPTSDTAKNKAYLLALRNTLLDMEQDLQKIADDLDQGKDLEPALEAFEQIMQRYEHLTQHNSPRDEAWKEEVKEGVKDRIRAKMKPFEWKNPFGKE